MIFTLSIAIKGLACDCTGGSLLQSIQNSALVVLVEIESQQASSVNAKIKELLKGVESKKQIKIQGDRGMDCLAKVTELKPGTRWILALQNNSSLPGDYQISSCGHHFAKVEKNDVIGYLTHTYLKSDKLEKLSIEEIKKQAKPTP